jgi:hypothetical protein
MAVQAAKISLLHVPQYNKDHHHSRIRYFCHMRGLDTEILRIQILVKDYKNFIGFIIIEMREMPSSYTGVINRSLFVILLTCSVLLLSHSNMPSVSSSAVADETTIIPEQRPIKDEKGNLNVVGVVRNNGSIPVQVTVGMNITEKEGNQDVSNLRNAMIQNVTFSRVVYPSTESPFKFVIHRSDNSVVSRAFVANVKEVPDPLYDNLVLNYSNIPVGENRALVGTVKNVGPFDIHDVSIYASVHNKNRTQIDSVKTLPISVVKAGQEQPFSAIPDPSIREEIEYFSCAGLDFDQPMPTLKVDDDEFIPFDLQAIAKISSLQYLNSTDSISFGVKHYNPEGGDLSLKVPQLSKNHSILVRMDDEIYDDTSITMDGKTVHIDIFIPPGDHEMNIQGIRGKF